MHSLPARSVLFAIAPESKMVISKAIPSTFQPDWCTSVEQAQTLLNKPYDLIVCCTLFDASRMFDFLLYCKANQETETIPFLCIRAVSGKFEDTAFQAVKIACNTLNAAGFIDYFHLTSKLGHEKALETISHVFSKLAANESIGHVYRA